MLARKDKSVGKESTDIPVRRRMYAIGTKEFFPPASNSIKPWTSRKTTPHTESNINGSIRIAKHLLALPHLLRGHSTFLSKVCFLDGTGPYKANASVKEIITASLVEISCEWNFEDTSHAGQAL